MTNIIQTGELRMIPLKALDAAHNVREVAQEDVDELASSIELLGQLVPAIVCSDGEDRYVLVAEHDGGG